MGHPERHRCENTPENTTAATSIAAARDVLASWRAKNSMTRATTRAMTRTFQLWRASEKKPHAQKTSMGHPASRFQASPISNRHLIHCPELETNLTCTKQTADHVSNRQFFAVLESPDTLPPGSFSRTDRPLPRAGKALHTTGNRERLIGNDMHSPANAIALQCATYIFLIGNEFQLQRASRKNPHPSQTALPSFIPSCVRAGRVNRMGHPDKRERVNPVPTRNQKQIPHTVGQKRATGFGMTDITRRRHRDTRVARAQPFLRQGKQAAPLRRQRRGGEEARWFGSRRGRSGIRRGRRACRRGRSWIACASTRRARRCARRIRLLPRADRTISLRARSGKFRRWR